VIRNSPIEPGKKFQRVPLPRSLETLLKFSPRLLKSMIWHTNKTDNDLHGGLRFIAMQNSSSEKSYPETVTQSSHHFV
jgi:hypothetical protein